MNPITAALESQRRTLERGADAVETMRLLPERLDDLASVEVGQTPSEVIHSENKLDLLYYEPLTDDRHDAPLLVVYALINRPYFSISSPTRASCDASSRTALTSISSTGENRLDSTCCLRWETTQIDTSIPAATSSESGR